MFAFVFVFVFVLRVNWCGVSCVLELCLCFVLGSCCCSWCVTFRCVDVAVMLLCCCAFVVCECWTESFWMDTRRRFGWTHGG